MNPSASIFDQNAQSLVVIPSPNGVGAIGSVYGREIREDTFAKVGIALSNDAANNIITVAGTDAANLVKWKLARYLMTIAASAVVPASAPVAVALVAITFTSTGGTGAVTYYKEGSLPYGLALSSAGVLSGTPTLPGTYRFAVGARDASGSVNLSSYTMVIS